MRGLPGKYAPPRNKSEEHVRQILDRDLNIVKENRQSHLGPEKRHALMVWFSNNEACTPWPAKWGRSELSAKKRAESSLRPQLATLY